MLITQLVSYDRNIYSVQYKVYELTGVRCSISSTENEGRGT